MVLDWWADALGLVPLVAHVLYGVPSPAGARRRVTLHNGDAFDASDGPPNPERLQDVHVVTANGQVAADARAAAGAVDVSIPDAVDAAWLVLQTPPTFIELAAERFDGYLAHEGLTHVLAARRAAGPTLAGREIYSKHVKVAIALASADDVAARPIGLPVEFVPDPGPVGVGAAWRVRLLADGQPAADVQVSVGHQDDLGTTTEDRRQRTRPDGSATVHLDRPGVWRLHAIVMTRHDDPATADWRSRWACLTIRV